MHEMWFQDELKTLKKSGVPRLRGYLKTIGSMGNCMFKPVSIPRSSSDNVHAELLKNFPIVFILGGPGAGKRTLCIKLAEHYDFLHIVTADLIREEVSTRTERAFRLARLMSQGQLVPTDILVELMVTKILSNRLNKNGVVISGFPRRKEQSILFDKFVRPPHLVLYLDVRDSVLSDRIMGRSITTREVVVMNYEEIKNQLKEFHSRTGPIVKHYKYCLVHIDGEADPICVFEAACEAVDKFLQKLDTNSGTRNTTR